MTPVGSTKAFHWQCSDNNPSMRRRLQSPPFPLFQVHADRWTNTLHILCCLETTHHLYICRWNWTVVQGASCPLWGDFAQTPSHTSIKQVGKQRSTASTHQHTDRPLKHPPAELHKNTADQTLQHPYDTCIAPPRRTRAIPNEVCVSVAKDNIPKATATTLMEETLADNFL